MFTNFLGTRISQRLRKWKKNSAIKVVAKITLKGKNQRAFKIFCFVFEVNIETTLNCIFFLFQTIVYFLSLLISRAVKASKCYHGYKQQYAGLDAPLSTFLKFA